MSVPHLMTLADLSVPQINRLVRHSFALKQLSTPWLKPMPRRSMPSITTTKSSTGTGLKTKSKKVNDLRLPSQSLFNKTIALLFSKRSTRTRVSAETAAVLLGGRALFLGKEDIQLGVNESVRDSARVLGGMCQGIFARVGDHSEIEELAEHCPVPVLNALSSLWHPTQILADILTLHEHSHLFTSPSPSSTSTSTPPKSLRVRELPPLPPLTITWLGDSSNVLHDILVSLPRMGHKVRVGAPKGRAYECPEEVWRRVVELGCEENIYWTSDPREAVNGADVVVTDTWISMGQEAEKEQRLKDFQGYQVTEALCAEGGAKENWKFLHCLPRKQHEVDDEVFYGPRSLVFPEADNRKWTIMACFDLLFGKWDLEAEAESYSRKSEES
ncbi:ornithine carbamoyltransferase [Sistotremastrum suecicum HHB10207 ss-3]|uniref:ornithine carbamoyltransferase n=1 Tax=Sistotremastrum suecicum HHB10207 ss-3 TaxID=1314776 RepID=A0A166DKQ8_9AGAM|nr:ornithine carbamoyltransferase [Sistotremastrum suecicum HHB10207 ss-3]